MIGSALMRFQRWPFWMARRWERDASLFTFYTLFRMPRALRGIHVRNGFNIFRRLNWKYSRGFAEKCDEGKGGRIIKYIGLRFCFGYFMSRAACFLGRMINFGALFKTIGYWLFGFFLFRLVFSPRAKTAVIDECPEMIRVFMLEVLK